MCQAIRFNSNESTKHNIQRIFLPTMIAFMAVTAAVLSVMAGISIAVASGQSITSMENQMIDNAIILAQDGSNLLKQRLIKSLESSTSFISHAVTDTTRDGGAGDTYSQGDIEAFYDFNPAEPMSTDSRHPVEVSFVAPTWMIPFTTDLTTFTEAQLELANQSAHLKNFFPQIYDMNEQLIQSYVCYKSEKMFVRYPGNITEDRSYDCTGRGWYLDAAAKAYDEKDYIVTNPYQDFNIYDWMITIAQSMYDDNGNFIGVTGSDLTIQELLQIVNSTRILETGKITIFQTDGTVVADQEWTLDVNSEGYTYSDLQSPGVPDSAWDQIKNTPVGEVEQIEYDLNGETYFAITSHLDAFDDQFLVTVFFNRAESTAGIQESVNNSAMGGYISIGILWAIAIVIVGIQVPILHKTSMDIVAPIEDSIESINDMARQLGGPGQLKRRKIRDGLGKEGKAFAQTQRDFADYIQGQRQAAHDAQYTTNVLSDESMQDKIFGAAPMEGGYFPDDNVPYATIADQMAPEDVTHAVTAVPQPEYPHTKVEH